MLLFIVIGILSARSTLADHYYVPSGSMEHTLVAGDRVVVDKRAYGLRVPFTTWQLTNGAPVARGDVVIFDSPRDGKRLIKRIVAVGGVYVVRVTMRMRVVMPVVVMVPASEAGGVSGGCMEEQATNKPREYDGHAKAAQISGECCISSLNCFYCWIEE